MKKFENVSEYQILRAAWLYYSNLYLEQCEALEFFSSDNLSESFKNRYKKISDELHDALVEFRKGGNISD